ncbi:MAG: hypothetical protein Q8P62_01700 [Candidatus Peregrinibacteria bacterium]|nr:hypothetical protein [Candidatus Peregrinibacteria bacterium]
MENKLLIDLSVKYGLDSAQISKVAAIIHQSGVATADGPEAIAIAEYLCESGFIDKPSEEIMQELKLKGLSRD